MAQKFNKELRGVDTIPDQERNSSPNTLISIFVGANLSLSVMVFGWLSILYGLSWWESVSAILVGTFFGALFVARSSLLGWRAATNNSVASGAYFGVRGRLIASVVGLLLCLQYVALTIWTGGEMFAGGWARLLNTEISNYLLGLGYLIISILVVVIAIFGFSLIVKVNKVIVPAMLFLLIISIISFLPEFDLNYAGDASNYALGSFWPTWLLAALTCGAAGPISYVTQTGDWTRYINSQVSSREVISKTFIALMAGLTIPTLFGAFIAVASFDEESFSVGYVAGAKTWLLIPLLLISIIGSLGQGAINLYSMGLDLDAIFPRLTRSQSTILVAVIAFGLVFLGKFAYDAESAVTNSVLFLTVLASSWMAITLYSFIKTRGAFDQNSLQIFNTRRTGGLYWFKGGWNFRVIASWMIGSLTGILGVSSIDYVGPISHIFNDIDVSIPLAVINSLLALQLFGGAKSLKEARP